MKPAEIVYGKYIIRAGQLSGEWTARAFHRSPAARKGTVMEAIGESRDQAIIALKRQFDAAAQAFMSMRRRDERSGCDVPSSDEYAAALIEAPLAAAHIAMLKAHSAAGDFGLTAGELARAAGYAEYSAANMHYGKCGRLFAEVMNVRAPDAKWRDEDVPTGVMAWEGAARPNGEFVWVMYPELREAVGKIFPSDCA